MKTADPLSRFGRALNGALRLFFLDGIRITLRNPKQSLFFFRTVRRLGRDASRRSFWQRRGIRVPPIIIFSITNECNLNCRNCYQQALHPAGGAALSEKRILEVISEAEELGVSFFVFAGGEPFLRKELLDITGRYPGMLFLVFTNGMLIDDDAMRRLRKQRNVILLVSLEGQEEETDGRRGEGVHAHIERLLPLLRSRGIFFGLSLTITSANFRDLTDYRYIRSLNEAGCRFFLFLEYTPVLNGTEGLVLSRPQRRVLMERMDEFHRTLPALFIAVPGHEAAVGGCLAAGRGFIHITARGKVEPCPFAPFSDTDVAEHSLKSALQSDLLRTLRQYPEKLRVTQGGCCLWQQRDWVRAVMREGAGKDRTTPRSMVRPPAYTGP